MKSLLLFFTFSLATLSFSQSITGSELLEKALQYHDPNNNWQTFNGTLNVTMETPNNPNRVSEISINLPEEYFYVKAAHKSNTTEFTLKKDSCEIAFNGFTEISEADIKTHRLTCDRAKMYKNYYTYLYGLPMKLKDPGTHIAETIEKKTFKGKEYLVLKATYEANVGSDVWFFYFDPTTYAMEIYQFFKTDDSGKLKSDSGEYILLTGEHTVNSIKIPKDRAWYYNKDDKYLGTDVLKN
jgi:hypothetical protein